MKERPIIFSAPMVRAILEGGKTQTRRIVKLRPDQSVYGNGQVHPAVSKIEHRSGGYFGFEAPEAVKDSYVTTFPFFTIRCPYGKPGDRLWVKESIYYNADSGKRFRYDDGQLLSHRVSSQLKYRHYSSLFCPRAASRITLEIADVRVHRVREISEDDAKAEGSYLHRCSCPEMQRKPRSPIEAMFRQTHCHIHGEEFSSLWDSINGKGSWESNPWVWALTFKVIK